MWLCKFEPSSCEEKLAELINRAVWRGRRNECDLSWPTRPPTPAPSSWPPWSPVENLLTSLPVPRLALLDRYTTIYLDILCWLKIMWYGCEWNTPSYIPQIFTLPFTICPSSGGGWTQNPAISFFSETSSSNYFVFLKMPVGRWVVIAKFYC